MGIAEGSSSVDEFTAFVYEFEPRLRHALSAAFGADVGHEAACEALACGWERWDQVRGLDNPVGYLYTIGRNWARRSRRPQRSGLHMVASHNSRKVEPGLMVALGKLSERQRTVVVLLHCYQWSLAEAAEVIGLAKTSAQNHLERAMAALRCELGEDQ